MANGRRHTRRRARQGWIAPGSLDPVPDEVVDRAKAAFDRRTEGGELAVRVSDSLVDEEDASAEDYWLRFEHPSVRIDVNVLTGGDTCDLRGRIDPLETYQVELEPEDAALAVATGAPRGEFAFAAVPRGVLRLYVVAPAGVGRVRTDWFRV